jgi:acyl-CoA synthetase (AMP-forming)/AMP-acid ligase II
LSDHIIHRIARRAREATDAIAVRFVQDVSGTTRSLTWGELARGAWAARAEFVRRGLVPGDRVLLMLPTGQPYVNALLGALWAGLAPTTLFPMAGAGSAIDREIRDLIGAFGPHAIVGAAELQDGAPQLIAADCFENDHGTRLPEVPDYASLRSLSYVQFTSGSTGKPRGLALHWPAIVANLEMIARATGMRQGLPVVSWLPMYHDMGIFGSLLTTLHAGCELVLMDPSVFTANPLAWLRVIHEQRGTITVAPPSALKVCLDLLRRRPQSDLDLSCLTQVICGAEPIPPGLLPAFEETLGPYGTRATALRPVYGMAEATLAVSFTPLGRGARVDHVDRQEFETAGIALSARGGGNAALEWVSAGCALPGVELRILDEDGKCAPERRVGRVWVCSPSLYDAALEHGAFHPREGHWLETGDLGYLAEGELYITGRSKDLIIKNGRNYSPERLEQLAGLVEDVRRCAAFGIFDEAKSTERIVLMIETPARSLKDPEMRDRLRLRVRRELGEAGYQVDEICLLSKSALPLTTSGKVRRRQCREIYLRQSARPVRN